MVFSSNLEGRLVRVVDDMTPPGERNFLPVVECKNIADYFDNYKDLAIGAKKVLRGKKRFSLTRLLYNFADLEKSIVLYSMKNVNIDEIGSSNDEKNLTDIGQIAPRYRMPSIDGAIVPVTNFRFIFTDNSGKYLVGTRLIYYVSDAFPHDNFSLSKENDKANVLVYAPVGNPPEANIFSMKNHSLEARKKGLIGLIK